ncbi:hypothetical protein QQP08_010543 [Theobroma cacao]|nr:hypothetical protein QQP08_010543 [Theobroma cacao]
MASEVHACVRGVVNKKGNRLHWSVGPAMKVDWSSSQTGSLGFKCDVCTMEVPPPGPVGVVRWMWGPVP